MANPKHLAMIRQGAKVWNEWRLFNREEIINLRKAVLRKINLNQTNLSYADLRDADLQAADISGADLSHTILVDANLREANLYGTDFSESKLDYANLMRADLRRSNFFGASLVGANLSEADLMQAKFWQADLTEADLIRSDLSGADLHGADLSGANLTNARLVETNLGEANLKDCRIYGISAWGVKLKSTKQFNLIITRAKESVITVDNLEVAQFIYLLLNNDKIRDVINTLTTKVVLILGRFTPERKAVLDAIREELRKRDYLPVLFDFDKPATRDITETMRTLAHLSRFIIADLSDPKSIPLELQAVVPDLAVPVQPLILSGQQEFSMFVDLRKRYHWVLTTHQYTDINDLLASLGEKVIAPAEQKAKELEKR